jgi:hypothetical protein
MKKNLSIIQEHFEVRKISVNFFIKFCKFQQKLLSLCKSEQNNIKNKFRYLDLFDIFVL